MSKLVGTVTPNAEIKVVMKSGARGKTGKNNYELWLDAGNVGSMDDYLTSLGAYIHPENHPASMIVEDEDRNFVTKRQRDNLSGYVYEQIKASKTWNIHHTLDKYPSISIVDSSGNQVTGSPNYIDKNNVAIEFTSEFSGRAYLN